MNKNLVYGLVSLLLGLIGFTLVFISIISFRTYIVDFNSYILALIGGIILFVAYKLNQKDFNEVVDSKDDEDLLKEGPKN